MSTERRFLLTAVGLLCLSAAACAQVLDIQNAHIDPTLSAGYGGASAAGASGSGGAVAPLAESGGQDPVGNVGGLGSGGGSGGPSESTAGANASLAGAPETPSACSSYCAAIISNCTGNDQQYRTLTQCLEVCKQLPPGSAGDDNVNSVGCRIRQAHLAESEPLVYCKAGGPLGAGKCGSNCESYCALMQLTCTADSTAGNQELSYFKSTEDCLADCAALPADPSGPTQYSSSMASVPSSLVGNNVYCRTYHLTAALEEDAPSEHCPHAVGGDPCNPQ